MLVAPGAEMATGLAGVFRPGGVALVDRIDEQVGGGEIVGRCGPGELRLLVPDSVTPVTPSKIGDCVSPLVLADRVAVFLSSLPAASFARQTKKYRCWRSGQRCGRTSRRRTTPMHRVEAARRAGRGREGGDRVGQLVGNRRVIRGRDPVDGHAPGRDRADRCAPAENWSGLVGSWSSLMRRWYFGLGCRLHRERARRSSRS